MAKTTPLGIRLPADTREALKKAADEDMRSMSSLAEKVLTDWLREKGYLPKD